MAMKYSYFTYQVILNPHSSQDAEIFGEHNDELFVGLIQEAAQVAQAIKMMVWSV